MPQGRSGWESPEHSSLAPAGNGWHAQTAPLEERGERRYARSRTWPAWGSSAGRVSKAEVPQSYSPAPEFFVRAPHWPHPKICQKASESPDAVLTGEPSRTRAGERSGLGGGAWKSGEVLQLWPNCCLPASWHASITEASVWEGRSGSWVPSPALPIRQVSPTPCCLTWDKTAIPNRKLSPDNTPVHGRTDVSDSGKHRSTFCRTTDSVFPSLD